MRLDEHIRQDFSDSMVTEYLINDINNAVELDANNADLATVKLRDGVIIIFLLTSKFDNYKNFLKNIKTNIFNKGDIYELINGCRFDPMHRKSKTLIINVERFNKNSFFYSSKDSLKDTILSYKSHLGYKLKDIVYYDEEPKDLLNSL